MRGRSLTGFLALLLTAGVVAAACSGGDDDAAGEGRTDGSADPSTTLADRRPVAAGADVLRLGLSGVETLDPVGASPASVSDVMLTDLVYDSLTALDEDGTAVPDLASFVSNEDGTLWRFTLVDDATFTDGSAVTADDVVFSLERVRERAETSLAALRLDGVESIAALDERTIDITLDAPSAVLPEVLSSPLYAVTDRQTVEPYLAGGDQTPNASGDHEVTMENPRRLVLRRMRGTGPGTVVVDLFDGAGPALDAFLDGDLDWTIAPPDRLGDAIAAGGRDGLVPFHGGLFLGLDPQSPPLDDPRLRRAIAMSIDRAALVDAVFGPSAQPLLGVVPAGVPGAVDACIDPCGPKPDEATALVAEQFPGGADVEIQLLVDDSEAQEAVAGVLEEQLAPAGITVGVTTVDVATYEQLVAAGQQQLFLFGSLGVSRSPASHLPPLFESTSPDNLTGLTDAFVDAAIASARAQSDVAQRRDAWRSVEALVLDAAVAVPLVQFRTTGVVRPGIEGFVVRADGSVDLSDLTIEDAAGG